MSGKRDDDIEVDAKGDAYVTLAGVRAKLVTHEEAETVAFVACANFSYYRDDVQTHCNDCGSPIVHRPYMPVGPPKVCLRCAAKRAAK